MFSYNLKSDIFKTDIFETVEKHFIDKSKESNFIKISTHNMKYAISICLLYYIPVVPTSLGPGSKW